MKKIATHISSLILLVFTLMTAFSEPATAQTDSDQQRVYIQVEILGMACPYCAFGMEKELKKIAGVEKVEIELKEGLAFISTPTEQKPTASSLKKIIVDAGFTAGEVKFSNIPFGTQKAN